MIIPKEQLVGKMTKVAETFLYDFLDRPDLCEVKINAMSEGSNSIEVIVMIDDWEDYLALNSQANLEGVAAAAALKALLYSLANKYEYVLVGLDLLGPEPEMPEGAE